MRSIHISLPVLAAAFGLLACGEKSNEPAVAPPMEVGVVTVQSRLLTLTSELPGRTEPYRIAEVRPQVGGIILKRMFEEGSEVREGQQLYQIDPKTYQAALDSARATLARTEAVLTSAKLLAGRYQPLVAARAVSQQEYDNARAAELQAVADVAAAKAALETAVINLAYTKVSAPISGRIGRSAITDGALVTASQPDFLAVIQQLDPIYVDVTQSSVELLRLRQEIRDGHFQKAAGGQLECALVLEDGTEYGAKGQLEFSEVTVSRQTGAVTLRALFPNPYRVLLPGMFVHARIAEGVAGRALLVPQQAVSRNNRGEPTVWLVTADDRAELRIIRADRAIGSEWLVKDGLKAGDKIVVEGWQKLNAGREVKAVEVDWPATELPSAEKNSPAAEGNF
jgi:membrane fusion protein (multidrug efflux system)